MATLKAPAEALKLWRHVCLEQVRRNEPDLSLRQTAVLLTVYCDVPPHTVRDLARKLQVSKPVITRALTAMSKLDLVARKRDQADRRNVLVQRTVKGALYLERVADLIGESAGNL